MFLAVLLVGALAHAQLTPLDSTVGLTAQKLVGRSPGLRVTLDSALLPFAGFFPPTTGDDELRISGIDAVLDTAHAPAVLDVRVEAWRTATSSRQSWSTTLEPRLTSEERRLLETNPPRFVKIRAGEGEASSLWSSVIEPALVVLGAGVIVALFFLIRS